MDRMKALEWWKKLNINSQKDLACQFFHHMPFVAVDKSSSMINRIYDSVKQQLSGSEDKSSLPKSAKAEF